MNAAGKNIKRLRGNRNMTQDALAEQMHVTRQAVSSWETGKTQPDIETLTALAAAFGTDANELIYGVRTGAEPYPNRKKAREIFLLVCAALMVLYLAIRVTVYPAWREAYYHLYTYRTLYAVYILVYGELLPMLMSWLCLGGLSMTKDIRIRKPLLRRLFLTAAIFFSAVYLLALICVFVPMAPTAAGEFFMSLTTLAFSGVGWGKVMMLTAGVCFYLGANR